MNKTQLIYFAFSMLLISCDSPNAMDVQNLQDSNAALSARLSEKNNQVKADSTVAMKADTTSKMSDTARSLNNSNYTTTDPPIENPATINWQIINIEGVGSIKLPPSMEIQNENYKNLMNKVLNISDVESAKVIFQQKNLNNLNKSSFSTYARVIIKKQLGEYKNIKNILTQNEADDYNNIAKNEIEETSAKSNTTILKWYPATITTLNGYNAITFAYKRQIDNNTPTISETFIIQNNFKLHILIFEHRLDNNNWNQIFENIKTTIKII